VIDARYDDIMPNERIIDAYDISLGDQHISISFTRGP